MENKPYSLQDTWDQHFEYGTGSYNAGQIPIPIHNCIKDMIFKATEELRKENDELKEKVHIKHQKFCETFSLAELRTQGLNQAVDKLEKIQNELSKAFLKIAEQYTEIERLTQSSKEKEEQMVESLRIYESQNQSIIKLKESNKELVEALKVMVAAHKIMCQSIVTHCPQCSTEMEAHLISIKAIQSSEGTTKKE